MHIYSFNYNFSASNGGLYTYLPIYSARYINSFRAQQYRFLQRLFPSYEVEYDGGIRKHVWLKNGYDAKI